MKTIEINKVTYRVGKLPALAQFHVSRRLGPVIATMGIELAQLKDGMKLDFSDFIPLLGPITDVMAKMSDADVNYIIFTSLGVVSRQQDEAGKKFAPITTNMSLLFEDIDMPVMLRLTVEVLRDNLQGFLPGLSDDPTSQSS